MTDLPRWLNPTTVLTTEDDARVAGRAGAVGAFLQAANGLLGGLIIAVNIDGYLAQLRRVTVTLHGENSAAGQAGLAMMTPSLVYFTIATSVVISLVYAVLGWVQWRKPNAVIPLLLGLFSAYGLLTMALSGLNREVRPGSVSDLAVAVGRGGRGGLAGAVLQRFPGREPAEPTAPGRRRLGLLLAPDHVDVLELQLERGDGRDSACPGPRPRRRRRPGLRPFGPTGGRSCQPRRGCAPRRRGRPTCPG